MKQLRALGAVTDVIFSILVPTALCAFTGRWLDRRFSLSPPFTILGLLFSLVLVVIIVIRKARSLSKLIDETQ